MPGKQALHHMGYFYRGECVVLSHSSPAALVMAVLSSHQLCLILPYPVLLNNICFKIGVVNVCPVLAGDRVSV